MPEKATLRRAQRDKRQGKSASTQAGEFVREELHHVREGKHGARSAKQAIAIGLSKARRAGVKLATRPGTRDKAEEAKAGHKPSTTRSRATRKALKKEGRAAASHTALSRQARKSALRRTAASRSRAAKKAAATRKRNS
ncbi:MAG: DUF6496 domain-containing protein [Casimicrobiaceae bacterium]|jgi:hypothetical protein